MNKIQKIQKFLFIVFLTILAYRTGTYIIIYFWGNTTWWQGVYSDNLNHWQIGIVLLALSVFRFRSTTLRQLLAAIGTGMIIDEISDLIKLFHLYPLPPHFRDSLVDLAVIIATYILFAAAIMAVTRISCKRHTKTNA